MKTKNLYYHTVFKRSNNVKEFILHFFLAICSWFRVFIEVFTRKSFGERYFLFPLCLFVAGVLAYLPFIKSYGAPVTTVIGENFVWYAYIAAFLIFSFKRWREVKREPGVFDLAKFSLSRGIIHPFVRNLGGLTKPFSNKIIAIYIEPGIFLLAGIILAILKQNIGYLLIVSSVVYSLSWSAEYYLGEQFTMNTIDEIISNEELVNNFVHDRQPEKTKGFEVYGDKPKDHNMRRKVAEAMIEEEPAVDVL